MKAKSFFIFLLAAAMCFYGCTTEYVYVMSDDGTGNSGTDESSGLEEVDDVCTKMTDENFKEYCYENFDADNDGKVSMKEAELVTAIDCSTAEDFAGIEYFTNLESFTSHSAKYLDLSYNIVLSYINLSYRGNGYWNNGAPVQTLDLSHNINLKEIAEYAFAWCESLTSIDLPDGLTSIGDSAFRFCRALTSVALPKGLTSTGTNAFCGCSSLTSVAFSEGLTTIGNTAFQSCSSLTSVTFPESLTLIDSWAFFLCTGLTSVVFPENLTSIKSYAFSDCTGLTSITFLGNNLTSIGSYAFENCTGPTAVVFPESLTSINKKAFSNCAGLTSVEFPESLTSIGDKAFTMCTSLSSVTIKATTPPVLGEDGFSGIDSSAVLYVPSKSVDSYKNSDWVQWFSQILAL